MGIKSLISGLYNVKSRDMTIGDVVNSFGFGFKHAGVTVNTATSIRHSTVYSCIRDKSESIGQLPIRLYRVRQDNTKEELLRGRAHRILTRKPNDFMTMQDLLQMYVTSLELYGNFYAYKVLNDRGSLMEILPFRFQNNVVPQMDMNGNVFYTYVTNDNKPKMSFAGDEIIHIKLNSLDGIKGMSPITYNAATIGMGISQATHMSSLLKNGAMPSGLLETNEIFKDRSRATALREEFDERYAGAEKRGKTVLLENGVTFKALTITPADSELLDSRKYTQQEICGIFRVPPRRIGVAATTKQADVEQENKDYYVNNLMPLVTAFENGINNAISEEFRIKADERGFVRGDLESQAKAMGEIFKLTAISINELREGVGYEPIEDGHYHAIDTNNITLGRLSEVEKIQAEQRLANAQSQNTPVEDEEDDD